MSILLCYTLNEQPFNFSLGKKSNDSVAYNPYFKYFLHHLLAVEPGEHVSTLWNYDKEKIIK